MIIVITSYDNSLTAHKLSHIPWRPLGITYRSNEAFFDIIEEIDAIIDPNGMIIMSEIQGYVSKTKAKLKNLLILL